MPALFCSDGEWPVAFLLSTPVNDFVIHAWIARATGRGQRCSGGNISPLQVMSLASRCSRAPVAMPWARENLRAASQNPLGGVYDPRCVGFDAYERRRRRPRRDRRPQRTTIRARVKRFARGARESPCRSPRSIDHLPLSLVRHDLQNVETKSTTLRLSY